ncbi:6-phosphofructokinase 2 [Halanaerobium saccharolyticum]|uniref:Tagatose-6-phosphate kinase n=1 Tax=Halanaerobium saccharolyticum TaxID=43595 RepID=A0A4R6LTQ3_9FIRM|nr:1-phosphofructokinase family hexose kinase [Halanaerobium saccharolyticum]TDO91975.1 6-phosphofructokinase 2 [Halanaerobium saccharolyticum]
MKNIVTFTLNPTIDKNSSVDHVKAEDKLYCDKPIFEPGGGGINVSRAIKKLGGSSLLLYTSGGFTGKKLDKLLAEEDLNKKAIEIKAETRENLIITEKTSSLQYRFGMPGPEINDQEYKKIFKVLNGLEPFPDYLVISGSIPEGVSDDIYAEMAELAKKKKAKVIVDVSGPPLKSVIKEGVFLIKPNLGEFQDFVGRELKNEEEIKEEALKLVENKSCQAIVISIGAGGALLVTDQKAEFMRPPTVPIKSKVGAGDSMVAGLVLSLARGDSLKNSFHYGLAAGSAAVMTPGTELCTKEDTNRLFKKMVKNRL